jgi:hypothetical protein
MNGLSPTWQKVQTVMLAALLFLQTFVYQAADTVKGVRERLRDVPTTEQVKGAVQETVENKVGEITQPVVDAAAQVATQTQETVEQRAERLQAALETLQAQLGAIEGVPGPQGEPGQPGADGTPGPATPSAESTTTTGPRGTTTTTRRGQPSTTTTTARCLARALGLGLGCD